MYDLWRIGSYTFEHISPISILFLVLIRFSNSSHETISFDNLSSFGSTATLIVNPLKDRQSVLFEHRSHVVCALHAVHTDTTQEQLALFTFDSNYFPILFYGYRLTALSAIYSYI